MAAVHLAGPEISHQHIHAQQRRSLRESGPAGCSAAPTHAGWKFRAAHTHREGRAQGWRMQSLRSYSAAAPAQPPARRRANFAHGAFQVAPRAFPQLCCSGRHSRHGTPRPGRGKAGSATGDNGNLRQRKCSCSASTWPGTLVAANRRVPRLPDPRDPRMNNGRAQSSQINLKAAELAVGSCDDVTGRVVQRSFWCTVRRNANFTHSAFQVPRAFLQHLRHDRRFRGAC